MSLEFMAKYHGYLSIYTDGSMKDYNTSAGVFIPTLGYEKGYRIKNGSVFRAELFAILKALEFLLEKPPSRSVIFVDSLSVLQAIESDNHYNEEFRDLRYLFFQLSNLGIEVVFCWIPSHVGIIGNEKVDFIAKKALAKPGFDMEFPYTVSDVKNSIEDIIITKWQDYWNNHTKGRFYFMIEPDVSLKVKFTNKDKHKQTTITRLRFGKTLLNDNLFLFKRHPTGSCSLCGISETVIHVLLYCRKYTNFHKFIKDKLNKLNLEFNIVNILSTSSLYEDIYNFIVINDISI